MSKPNKSATKKPQKRQKTNWGLFFRLCNQGRSNEEIAKKLGWKVDPKSEDPTKRVRAAKSLARTKGIKVGGKLVRLHDAKLRGVAKPKKATSNKARSKSRPKSQAKAKTKPEFSPSNAESEVAAGTGKTD